MILAIEISILPLGLGLILTFTAGFLLRSAQLRAHRRRILQLEKEMLRNHADILDLQKEKADLMRQMRDSDSSPVIPISKSSKEEGDKQGNIKVN